MLLNPACPVGCAPWESVSPAGNQTKRADVVNRFVQLHACALPKLPVVHIPRQGQHLVWVRALLWVCRVVQGAECFAFVLLRACSGAIFSPCFCAAVFMDLRTLTVVVCQALMGNDCHQHENGPFPSSPAL